jgi:hypothetical protein
MLAFVGVRDRRTGPPDARGEPIQWASIVWRLGHNCHQQRNIPVQQTRQVRYAAHHTVQRSNSRTKLRAVADSTKKAPRPATPTSNGVYLHHMRKRVASIDNGSSNPVPLSRVTCTRSANVRYLRCDIETSPRMSTTTKMSRDASYHATALAGSLARW